MPKRLKAADRRQQILRAAAQCFAKYGYSRTTTVQLARAARVSEPILYRHFDTKRKLFVALIDQAGRQAMMTFASVIGPITSPIEQLRALLRLNPATTDPRLAELYRVIFHAQSEQTDPQIQAALRRHYRGYADFLSGIITRAQQLGEVRQDVSAIGLAWQLIHLAVGFAMVKPLDIPGHATRTAVEQAMALLMEQLSGGRNLAREPAAARAHANRSSDGSEATPGVRGY